jgi:HEAT repeat protein
VRTRRTIALLLSLAFLAVGIAVILSRSPREPVSHGKPLSAWLKELDFSRPFVLSEEAKAAIRDTGTNGVPTLLRMILYRDSDLKLDLMKLADEQKLIRFQFADAVLIQQQGLAGLQALGPAGRAAVPELLKAFNDPALLEIRPTIASSFGVIGPDAREAIPTLLSALASTNEHLCTHALSSLAQIHEEPDLVVPALIRCLSDSNQNVRAIACFALGAFGSRAAMAVPALQAAIEDKNSRIDANALNAMREIDPLAAVPYYIKRLEDPEPRTRKWVAVYLGRIGPPSKPAVPALLKALQDADPSVRQAATNAVNQIDPEAAAKAGIK